MAARFAHPDLQASGATIAAATTTTATTTTTAAAATAASDLSLLPRQRVPVVGAAAVFRAGLLCMAKYAEALALVGAGLATTVGHTDDVIGIPYLAIIDRPGHHPLHALPLSIG